MIVGQQEIKKIKSCLEYSINDNEVNLRIDSNTLDDIVLYFKCYKDILKDDKLFNNKLNKFMDAAIFSFVAEEKLKDKKLDKNIREDISFTASMLFFKNREERINLINFMNENNVEYNMLKNNYKEFIEDKFSILDIYSRILIFEQADQIIKNSIESKKMIKKK